MRCKKCGLKQTYIRLTTNERVCRSCGYVEPLKKVSQNALKRKKQLSENGDELLDKLDNKE